MSMPFRSPPGFLHRIAQPLPGDAGADAGSGGLLFVFRGAELLVGVGPPSPERPEDLRVSVRSSWARLPRGQAAPRLVLAELETEPLRTLYLGTLDGAHCYAAEVAPGLAAPAGMAWQGLRALFSVLEDAHLDLAGRAVQLLDWDRNHRFCGRCAAPTVSKDDERARVCPSCRLTVYPRISPAVMALVRRERQILLGRGPHFPPGMFSALAGFAEAGETLEQCVAREVLEESGVETTNIRYVGSQPWPFPNSLMIAFVCDYAGGELRPQDGEIEEVAWFDIDNLPRLPGRISIARHLIETAVAELRGTTPR
jgi:NAD+ diphosphatase